MSYKKLFLGILLTIFSLGIAEGMFYLSGGYKEKITVSSEGKSLVYIENYREGLGSTTTIPVKIEAVEDYAGFEFKLAFDKERLQALSVTEGNAFEGYPSFFFSGTINNEEGMISSTFSVILGTEGQGTTTGDLAYIDFEIIGSGVAELDLYDVGVANRIPEYISIGVEDGSIATYDVNNDGAVNFIDAGIVWTHRTSYLGYYDKPYDVNLDNTVNFIDAGRVWANRD